MRPLRYTLILLILCSFLLNGCFSSMMDKLPAKNISEQLYIDARLHFAIKHPLRWKRLQIPVSSTEYRKDTIRWQIQGDNRSDGEMLIRSLSASPDKDLPDLLSSYLAETPELQTSEVVPVELAAGNGLKLLGQDDQQGRLTLVIKGQARDFIISLVSPSDRFAELLPIFQDIVNSFVEVAKPATEVN